MLQPDTIRLEYWKAILRLVLVPAREMVSRYLIPELAGLTQEHRFDAPCPHKQAATGRWQCTCTGYVYRRDASRVNEIMDKVSKRFFDDVLEPREVSALATKFAERAERAHKAGFDKQVRAGLGVDVLASQTNLRPVVNAFVSENVALIKSVPNQYFDDIEKTVTRGVSRGTRHEDIAKQLEDRYAISEDKAKLIARDQVGKFYGALNEARQTDLGVTSYIWRTANDNRVREEHEAIDGDTFQWDDPPEDGHPGEAVNCRCYAEPIFTDLLEE